MLKILFILLTLFFSLNVLASPDCDNEIYFTINEECRPTDNELDVRMSLNVSRTHSHKGCPYFVTFSKGSSPSYNRWLYYYWWPIVIPFQLYQDNSNTLILMDYPELYSANNALVGNFEATPAYTPGGVMTNTHYFKASFPSLSDSYPKGLYGDSFAVRLYSGTPNGDYELRETQYMFCYYRKTNTLNLSIVDTGATYDASSSGRTIDFGSMSTGLSQSFDVVIKSGAGYKLFFNSENGGALVHNSLPNAKVTYTVSVGGTPYSLPAGIALQVAQATGATPSEGARSHITIQLGTVSIQPAGSYGDNITVTVQTND